MPFPIYLPFYPGHEPSLIFSREAALDDYEDYLALADRMTTAAVFREEVPYTGPILDAGCGWGRWLIRLHRAGRCAIGLDLHHPTLQRIRTLEPALPLVNGAVAQLPVRSDSLAAIVSLGVVEHAEQGPAAALREFARVLQPGGRLLVSVPYNNPLRRLIFNALHRHYNTRWAGRGYYFIEYRFTRREIVSAVRDAGFEIRSWHPHDFLPPLSMAVVADRNILATRFVPTADGFSLHLPEAHGWQLEGWWARMIRGLHWLSPWLASAEILIVAEKPPAASSG